jgi:hypothetical protein
VGFGDREAIFFSLVLNSSGRRLWVVVLEIGLIPGISGCWELGLLTVVSFLNSKSVESWQIWKSPSGGRER